MLKNLLIATAMTGMLVAVPTGSALAQGDQIDTVTDVEFSDRCQVIKARLTAKINTFEKRRETHLRHYKSIVERTENIVKRLDNAGYNTDPITELLPELERRIDLFATNSQEFITDLKQARRVVCVSKEAYQNELKEARESLRETRRSARAIADFVHGELIPTIRKVISNPPTDEVLSDSAQ